ncbi:hypothetical protein NKL05_08550 [Mesorhizobium sp. C420B]|uniref:hypothetical protein n=1 Tax=unclassified Mesorhizobium TaxID=325217 RepID=UPI0012EBA33B|nr:hypothetical protein [Mesorhizobium sp. LSHC420B00]
MSDQATDGPGERPHVRIDFARLRRPADLGVRRASVFLALGSNAANHIPSLPHQLDDRMSYHLVPSEISDETRRQFNENFEAWIIGNALRDLVDAFTIFLKHCFPIQHMMATHSYIPTDLRALAAEVEMLSISAQYSRLRELIGLDQRYWEMFESFRKARNCLSHRMGLVSRKDVSPENNRLLIRWSFLGVFMRHPDGTEQPIDHEAIEAGHVATGHEGAMIIMRLTWKERSFAVGTNIRLTRHELSEICFAVHMATDHVIAKLNEFSIAQGIQAEHPVADPGT